MSDKTKITLPIRWDASGPNAPHYLWIGPIRVGTVWWDARDKSWWWGAGETAQGGYHHIQRAQDRLLNYFAPGAPAL